VRKSSDRGHSDHQWLNSYHTFSFAGYSDSKYGSFHSLRVINEDRVSPDHGFDPHPHREYEIFSYVVSGALRHKDSMGNKETIKRGGIQFTSAGTGMWHSEYNDSSSEPVHFLQMWVKPNKSGLKPSYQTKVFSDAEKTNKLRLVVSPDGADGSVKIHQDFKMYASILTSGSKLSYDIAPGRDVYVHLVQDTTGMHSEANENGLTLRSKEDSGSIALKPGDGVFLSAPSATKETVTIDIAAEGKSGSRSAELLVYDVKRDHDSVIFGKKSGSQQSADSDDDEF